MKTLMLTLSLLLLTLTTFSQNLPNSKLYAVSTDGNDVLHSYNFDTQTWSVTGETGTENLKALEFDNLTKTLYGVDEGKLGTIDVISGQFTGFGAINSGEGAYGTIVLDDIEGLTYYSPADALFAIHRIAGFGPGTNDVLFQIDPVTGLIKKDAMIDPSTGDRVDYVVIPEVWDGEDLDIDLFDVSGIVYNPYTHQLYGLQTQQGSTIITEINYETGEVEAVIYDIADDFVTDITINQGALLAVTGINDRYNSSSDQLIDVDLMAGTTTVLESIDQSQTYQNFQSLAASYPINDLALKVSLSPNQTLPITEEDAVNFDITIYNQGEVTISDLSLAGYIPDDVYLDDASWSKVENTAYKNISQTLAPGDSIATTLQVKVKEGFEGEIKLAVEIESAFSNGYEDYEGNPIRLADIDSHPDDYNNEINISDNETNSRGPNKLEDEDDHDIEIINVTLNLQPSNCTCYSVAQNNGAVNELYGYNESNGNWYNLGKTGTTDIKALTYVQSTNTLFGIEQGKLGTIDVFTGQFTGFGIVNSSLGPHGTVVLDDIEGLAYDTQLEVLFAVHRIPGNEIGTNDVLFQIDPTTGAIIKNAMTNPATGDSVDFVSIDEIFDGDFGGEIFDVSGLAYNQYANELFAIHTNDYGLSGITILNNKTAEVEFVILDIDDMYVSDIAFYKYGKMTAVSGINEIDSEQSDQFIEVDLAAGASYPKGKIAQNGTAQNFQSVACKTTINDLALKVTLSEHQELSGYVSYDVTIYNQGDVRIDEFTLSSPINKEKFYSYEFVDFDYGNGYGYTYSYGYVQDDKLYQTFDIVIEPGSSFTAIIYAFPLSDFKGSIKTSVEINSAYSYDITDDFGNLIPLPDVDSVYDDLDNETNIVDNDINGGGILASEDEDDHDIEIVKINIPDCDCFSVAQNNGSANDFYGYNALNNTWVNIGKTGTTNLKALTYDQKTKTLYGIEKGKLGTIDISTGKFTSMGLVNSGEGEYGTLVLDDIEGLAYDNRQDVFYAVHRIPGDGSGTNDVLFKIDPKTGVIIKNGFPGNLRDEFVDYTIIPEVYLGENLLEDSYDVYGLAYNIYTDQLIAIHSKEGADQTKISEFDKEYGYLNSILFDYQFGVLKGITLSKHNPYFAINSYGNDNLDELVSIELSEGNSSTLGLIDSIGTSNDFQSLACQLPANDLALKIETSIDQIIPFVISDDQAHNSVVLDMITYNQGEIQIDEFNLNIYPTEALDSLDLIRNGWTFSDKVASKNFQQNIKPGKHYCATEYLKVKDNFEGLLKLSAEIESAYSYDITDNQGNPIALSDIDSRYDNENNEINIIDNEVNGGGASVNEDEDDHDIVYIQVYTNATVGARFDEIQSPCYAIAHNNGEVNTLSVYNKAENFWYIVDIIGTTGIKALAINHTNNLIYAVDNGMLGIINADAYSGNFTPIGIVNTGNGDHGTLTLDNIYGLAFDASQGVLYASHRITGDNDVVFQIDPVTGLIIPGAMADSSGNPADYAVIPAFAAGVGILESEDITDLTINPFTGKLYLMLGKGNFESRLCEFDKQTLEYKYTALTWHNKELGSAIFISEYEVYATLYQPGGETQLVLNNIQTESIIHLGPLDKFNTVSGFLSLDCSQFICVDEKNISETYKGQGVISSGIYQADNTVNSDGIINGNNQQVTYKAGIEISLESGFEVKTGSEFSAEIKDCQ